MVKQRLTAVLSVLVLSLTWSSFADGPVTYFFSGQVTEQRTQNSVFTGGIGDSSSGYFTYDPTAAAISFGYYPLVDFRLDGKALNFANGTEIPFLPGVLVRDGPADMLEIRGFYLPAAAGDPTDNGSTSLVLTDFTGSVFVNNSLPATLSLASFNDARIVGPVFVSSPFPLTDDRGVVTTLALVPEVSSWVVLGLGLLATYFDRRRLSKTDRPRRAPAAMTTVL
jgi:hypothetical protein